MADRVVLDAHAVLVFLGEEPGWAEVEEILRTGEPWMTLVNLGEVAYILERTSDAGAADEVWANLRAESRPGGVRCRRAAAGPSREAQSQWLPGRPWGRSRTASRWRARCATRGTHGA